MEIQPKLLSASEKEFVKSYLASYKQFREVVFRGDLYRISSPYEGPYYSMVYVSKDSGKAVFFAYCLDFQGETASPVFRLQGLDPEARYRVSEIGSDGSPRFWGDGRSFGGDYLMGVGLNLDLRNPGTSAVMLIEKI